MGPVEGKSSVGAARVFQKQTSMLQSPNSTETESGMRREIPLLLYRAKGVPRALTHRKVRACGGAGV